MSKDTETEETRQSETKEGEKHEPGAGAGAAAEDGRAVSKRGVIPILIFGHKPLRPRERQRLDEGRGR